MSARDDFGAWLDQYVEDAVTTAVTPVQARLDVTNALASDLQAQVDSLSAQLAACQATQQSTPAPALTAFGVSTPTAATFTKAQARWHSYRIFYPNALPASWGADARLSALKAGDVVVVSAKDMTPAQVAEFAKGKPDGVTCYLSWHHEPENDALDKAAYRATWATLGPAIRSAGCIPMLILMGWTADAGSGRDYRDWWSPGSVDAIGWDAYNSGNKNGTYEEPAHILAGIKTIAAANGLPWGITETGAKDFGTVNGQTRAQWAAAFAAALKAAGAITALWWDQATGTFDVRLDTDTAAAWQ